jgi:endo-1,4-beta-xylanase
MKNIKRRDFLKTTALAGAGIALMPNLLYSSPTILTGKRVQKSTQLGEIIFQPNYVQNGRGPHLLDWAYASDNEWNAFLSNITATKEGVVISDTMGKDKFGIDVRWNVEGFGYIFITADNGGEFYTLPPSGKSQKLNLNFELAKSRVMRNRQRLQMHSQNGWIPSREVKAFLDTSEQYYEDARKVELNADKVGFLSQKALYFAMWGGEKMELDKARHQIELNAKRKFYIGCDARGYFQMDPDDFMSEFSKLFNYATITHYLISKSYQDFEPQEGEKQFNLRTAVFKELRKRDIVVEGRPLFWFYPSVTPDWLRNKPYDSLLKYVEKHTKEVVSHYGDEMYAWEVVNEAHDWANELQLRPEQIVEVTKLACDIAKDTNPKVHRLINNCCPYAEYVQLKKWGELDAKYPQRTPYQFLKDLDEAGVDFTITGQQMYFPYRDLSDTIILIERLQKFGRPVQLTEVGASSGPNKDSVETGRVPISTDPYIWHGQWTEELQAEWTEGLYTLAFSKPWIEAVNWYDYVDPYSWIKGGGLLASPKGEKKLAFHRLMELKKKWNIT